jgi:hypothetical protein
LQLVEIAEIVSAHAEQARVIFFPQLEQVETAGSALALQKGQASIMVTTSAYWTGLY